jgi:pimeloyl-ACP methyl ester carboxylesterase
MRSMLAMAAGCLLLGACSSDEAQPREQPPSATAVVLYGPAADTELTPFPSDRYTAADATTETGLRVTLGPGTTADQLIAAYPDTVAQLNQMDGFSTTGGVFVKLSAAIDPRGIERFPAADPPILDPVRDASEYRQPGSPLFLVDVDPGSPERGQAIGIVPRWFAQAKDEHFLEDDFTLLAQPAVPLRSGTRYAFAVTDALLAHDGTPVGRSPAMHAALTGASDPYAVELRAAVGELASAVGVEPQRIVGASVFTTASMQRAVIEMAKARRAAPAPSAVEPWTIERAPSATDRRARLRASYPAPEFRKAKPDGKWQLDAGGAPIPQHVENLEVFMAISDATKGGPRPVVLYAHGLGGDKDGCWGTSERLAALHDSGVAVLAIDSPEHGSRGTGSTSTIDSVYGFFGIDPATKVFDIGRARDNFRQMASDQLELVRFIQTLGALDQLPLDANGNSAPDGQPDLDVSRLLYIGHSFGAVQGATIFALAPEIRLATWNVGGAGLMMMLRDSGTFSLVVKSLTPSGTPFGAVARFMATGQALVDPGDPLNYARFATLEPLEGVPGWIGRDVLLQEVVNDTIVPNSTTEALARAAGLGLVNSVKPPSGLVEIAAPVSANLPTGGTGVIAQFDKMNGGKTASHGDLIFSTEGRAQYVEFFKSGLAAAHATVPAPY